MNTRPRYLLNKKYKLKRRKAINTLFDKGKSFTVFPIRVVWTTVDQIELKAGVSASARIFRRAVDRNRIKRLLRETYRLSKNELQLQLQNRQMGLHIFFMYQDKELPTFNELKPKMDMALKKLLKQILANP